MDKEEDFRAALPGSSSLLRLRSLEGTPDVGDDDKEAVAGRVFLKKVVLASSGLAVGLVEVEEGFAMVEGEEVQTVGAEVIVTAVVEVWS